VVLLHHALLIVPGLAAPYYTDHPAPFGSWEWWISHTPLSVLWDGQAAVYVFFVLSGVVLAVQVEKSQKFNWRSYYPQRLARLYLPVWGAVLFAAATFFIVPRLGDPDSLWLQVRTDGVTIPALVKDLTLLLGTGGLASPLWSLRFEIIFSLALPLYMWISHAAPKLTALKLLGCIALITAGGYIGNSILTYIPMFLIGTILVTENRKLHSFARYVSGFTGGRVTMFFVALVLMSSTGIATGLGASKAMEGATSGLTTIGATLVVISALYWQPAHSALSLPAFQWLGTISFSLYLTHEPIVIAFGYLLQGLPPVVPIILAMVVALPTAWLFYRFVEKPSHMLAKKLAAKNR
jgi:peptidoglycan/LPS O-acetylase OafA/YrhL